MRTHVNVKFFVLSTLYFDVSGKLRGHGKVQSTKYKVQSFKLPASSTSSDSRLRKTAMMMPKPTAASAAATVITMKTNNWPDRSRKKLENATNVRFTAFSISSMHINIEMTFRLIMTPMTPIVNSRAESARYHESCGTINKMVLDLWALVFVLQAQQLFCFFSRSE